MSFLCNRNMKIITELEEKPVAHALRCLRRDLQKVYAESDEEGGTLILEKEVLAPEMFRIMVVNGNMILRAGDFLGFVYGVFWISRELLGVHDFWFWNDQKMMQIASTMVEEGVLYESVPAAVRFRGWFVNDEVLIHTWMVDREPDKPWEMVFETLLRCGGNMVIPGTDKNGKKYRQMASDMGLYITHHHAEPLGAEMFARIYPQLRPSYEEYPELFQKLWEEALEDQEDYHVIWNLGFRGQGDCPFWENDPRYDTPQKRGALISSLIRIQYEMVIKKDKDAICVTNLYGETMELYQAGYLDLPKDIIRIWADNGYGKMVSRRQGNHNPRISSMPDQRDKGKHGIYYHVSFFDLQAANHITMLPNSPEFVKGELDELGKRGVDQFWLINCSNVKPHVYFLDLIATYWKTGTIDIKEHRKIYCGRYYGADHVREVEKCFREYHTYAVAYGKREDEHAGEQFTNYVTRVLISQYMKERFARADQLLWFSDAKDLKEQIKAYGEICQPASEKYQIYVSKCESASVSMHGDAKRLFEDSILLQARIYAYCYKGAALVVSGFLYSYAKEWKKAFYKVGCARIWYLKAEETMHECEHGKWHGFYQNECLTDIKETAYLLEGLMSMIRNMGDGPYFYEWQREFYYTEKDKRVMLVLNMENHLTDQEIFELMQETSYGEYIK